MVENILQYQMMLNKMNEIYSAHEQKWKKSGDYFSVFSALGIERKEVRHSALLAAFLKPNEIHGISDRFLKEFLNRIDFNNFSTKDAIVKTEEVISNYRRLDIDIISSDGKYKVVIENKIDTKDHDKQISSYIADLKKQNLKDYKLVYLTLFGEEPIEKLSDEAQKHLICLSYKEDIISIISSITSDETLPNPISEIMKQYCITLKNITNQGVDNIMNEEIAKLLLDGNNIKLAEELYKQIDTMKISVMKEFVKLLEQNLKKTGRKFSILYKKENRLEEAVSRYVTSKATNDGEWLIIYIGTKADANFCIVFDPDGWYWAEFHENKELTDKFNLIETTDFKPLKISFKVPNEDYKEFVLKTALQKNDYVERYVRDIDARLKQMSL